jgi:hypothetical protein
MLRIGTNQSPARKTTEKKTAPAAQGVDLQRVVDLVADLMSMPRERIVEISRQSEVPGGDLFVTGELTQLGLTVTGVANTLRILVPTASVAANKGEQITLEFDYSFIDLLNMKI